MPINYLYIDDERTETLQSLIDCLENESEDKLKIKHKQVMNSIKAIVNFIKAGIDESTPFSGVIIDQDLKAESDDGNKADYFGTTLAQHLRTEMALSNIDSMPLVLLSNEDVIVESFEPDDASKNLFDYVVKKKEVVKPATRERVVRMLLSLVSAYSLARDCKKPLGSDLVIDEIQILLNCNTQMLEYTDNRFIDFLSSKASDPHALVGSIYSTLVQSAGTLLTEGMLKTKLGVSCCSRSWDTVKQQFEEYRYFGPFNELKARWWLAGIEDWWFKIHPDDVLQSLTCEERVSILREKLKLPDLTPIVTRYQNGDQSMHLWVNCVVSGHPLDPYDALRVRDPDAKVWEQPKYLDLLTHLNGKADKYVIHADDKKKVKRLIARLKPDVNE